MSDTLDQAADTTLFLGELALQHRLPVEEHTGSCLNCGEPVAGAFCDNDCRTDHEKRKRMLA